MLKYPRSAPTLFDALPHVTAQDLRAGDLLMHRGRPGCSEGGARPVVRVEAVADEPEWIRIVQAGVTFPGSESRLRARADQLVTLAPPYWPHGETRPITREDVDAAARHVGARAAGS